MLCHADRSTLVLIDYQEKLMPAICGREAVLQNAARLAHNARRLQIPVVVTRQVPEKLGGIVAQLGDPADVVFDKVFFDACGEAEFALFARTQVVRQRGEFIVAGCETHVCVLQTVLSLLAENHHVKLVADACGSRHGLDAELALRRASAAGAELVSTEMVLFEWLRHSDHAQFRSMQASIR